MANAVAKAHGRIRNVVALGIVLAGVLRALALDPSLDISQYAHTSWRVRDGFAKGFIYSTAQTPDGYLWLGTEFGLLRFDGVRAVPWQPPNGQQLPDNSVFSLLVTRDGALWIGTGKGLVSWKDGKLTSYSELSGKNVASLLQDRDGTVWIGTNELPSAGQLCAFRNSRVECQGGNGLFGPAVLPLFEDSRGNLWVGVQQGLWRWKPGRSEFFTIPEVLKGQPSFGEDDQSVLLVGTEKGLYRFVDGHLEPYTPSGLPAQFRPRGGMLRDGERGLWIATSDVGLVHVHHGKVDGFSEQDGLSGDLTTALLEDREGNIWAATTGGLDRFRDYAVPNLSIKQGLSNATTLSILAAKDGSVWIATNNGLNRWKDGQISLLGDVADAKKSNGKLNRLAADPIFQDSGGRIWIATTRELGYLDGDQFVPIWNSPAGFVHSIAEVPLGQLWAVNQQAGLLQISSGNTVRQIPWAGLGHQDFAEASAADPSRRGLWLGFYKGGLSYFEDGGVRKTYSTADGLGEGLVHGLRFGPRDALWAATEGGLSRIKDGHIANLTSKNGLPCDTVHWSMEGSDNSAWLYMPCGLVRITQAEMDGWVADPNKVIKTTVFDISDGVRTHSYPPPVQGVTRAPDGKIWFIAFDGVSVIDPHHLSFNKLPPPVHIEQIVADRKTYDTTSENGNVRLPPQIRDLQIDYTALSLVASEKVFFRYKLEGWDRDWQDVGTRRQAFYSNLPPRNYRFRVMACNNSGVWNEAGAFLDFSVAPAYYQTIWFRSLCVIAFLALLAFLYEYRLRQLARQFNMRLEERVNERTRIARDLHDTLLQSFQGVLLKFHAVTYLLTNNPDAEKALEAVIDQARQAIVEGRDAVSGLRSSALPASNDVARALSVLGEELAASQTDGNSAEFRVQVEGMPRNLAPVICDEVYRIGGEALRNAFRHAQAERIELEIRYDRRQFRLRVRDDGKGIDTKVLGGDGRPGHYGLPGMHERARLVGGKLSVWSQVGSGTEAELTIPAAVAYAKPPAPRRPMFFRRGA
jgi:signal transduction histidine kinase/ligand-binding sensor domain-containing protein